MTYCQCCKLKRRLAVPNFVCLVVWDAQNATVDEISALVNILLNNGVSYFCAWGQNCERVHDFMDEEIVIRQIDSGLTDEPLIMTTWHENQNIQDALFDFLQCTFTDEKYEDKTNSSLAIVISNKSWATEIKKALSNPSQFLASFPDDAE